jgi:hypothetical protein
VSQPGGTDAGLEDLAEPLEELFAGPPDTFTTARNALAAKLRELGRRPEADAVKALRKPSLAVWTVNQLARRRAQEVDALLSTSSRLRESQLAALSGGEPHPDFAAATRARRDLIAKLVGYAADILAEEGVASAKGHLDKVASTLLAAGDDEATASSLRRGLLTAELSPTGFGAAWGVVEPSDAGAGEDPAEAARRAEEARAETDRLEERAATAEARAKELGRRAEAAERAAAEARSEAVAAERAATEARRAAREARERADRPS